MASFFFIGPENLQLLCAVPHFILQTPPAQSSSQLLLLLGLLWRQLLYPGPEHIFQMSGKALTQPLLGPVTSPNSQAKPGMGNFMAEACPTQLAGSSQGALGEEDDVGWPCPDLESWQGQ